MEGKIYVGDEVKDKLSKFKGIVTAVHIYLNGCHRMTVTTTGKEPKSMSFDEPQLKVLKKRTIEIGSRTTGGPAKYMDTGR